MRLSLYGRGSVALALTLMVAGAGLSCGSSGGRQSPERPIVSVAVANQIVDVGERYHMDASHSFDPGGRGLTYFWTLLRPTGSAAKFEDHCKDDIDEICTQNFDACAGNAAQLCETNSDCGEGDTVECVANLGETSPECTTGKCLIGGGRKMEFATFVADVPGSYKARVLVQTLDANDTGTVELDTYPSLYLLGSLFSFGGRLGKLVAEFADAETFAEGASALVTSPTTGNLLLAIPGPPGRIREFDYRDGSDLGQFGETGDFISTPVAMAFSADDRIYVADADGTVRLFDATAGRFIRTLGDVTTGSEEIAAIALSPDDTPELLVVDGRAGEAVRRYDATSGASLGALGNVETVAAQVIDLAFFGDPATDLFVADAGGALIRCGTGGTGCAPIAAAAPFLASGGPTSIAVNPAADATDADVLIADKVGKVVVACASDGSSCKVFGDTQGLDSEYADIAYAPKALPEPAPPPTYTTTTTSTTLASP